MDNLVKLPSETSLLRHSESIWLCTRPTVALTNALCAFGCKGLTPFPEAAKYHPLSLIK